MGANGRTKDYAARETPDAASATVDLNEQNNIDDTAPSLVDRDLSSHLRQAVATVSHSGLNDPAHRATSVFLGTDAYRRSKQSLGELQADVMLECLPRFVRALGGRIVLALSFREASTTGPVLKHVEVEGQRRPVLEHGSAFLDLHGTRAVVSIQRSYYGSGENVGDITLATADDGAAIYKRWEAYARTDNYLKNRAFFADGTPIGRTSKLTWDDIVLPAERLRTIRLHVADFLEHRHRLKALGVKPRRGLIFSGPPGTGKTLLCQILADQMRASFLWVMPRHVTSPWSFQNLLQIARFVAPTVLLLENPTAFECGPWACRDHEWK